METSAEPVIEPAVPLSSAPAPNPHRSTFYTKSSSFFSRSPSSSGPDTPSKISVAGISSWAKNLKFPLSPKDATATQNDATTKSPLSLLGAGFTKKPAAKIPVVDEDVSSTSSSTSSSTPSQDGPLGAFTKGFLDTSRNAVKVVQTRARHLVSQNKRRYQEGGFDLDMTYITDSIIAMGFPAGDMSSGILGYVEGFYRNHMEEVIRFFETNHKGRYKVYNLCSERLYDASLLEGKVASFPFDDHNCPPLQLVLAFCQSAYSWLKEHLENVVVVHCKAGKARTGLMISCLLLYLKFFPTAEECMANYNERRCVDSKGLILPSQIRYVKYFERVLKDLNGEVPTGRKCILRGIRLHKCPYWIRPAITVSDHNGVLFSTKKHPRTKDMAPENIWFTAPRKGVMVFALPGERCVADLNGDFKILFHDRSGDFYCWLNTNMMETREVLNVSELDGFDKRRLPSPGFQVEVVIFDENPAAPPERPPPSPQPEQPPVQSPAQQTTSPVDVRENDDIFSDSEGEEDERKRSHRPQDAPTAAPVASASPEPLPPAPATGVEVPEAAAVVPAGTPAKDESSDYVHVKEEDMKQETSVKEVEESNDFRAIAADASVFTFGDEDDYDSDSNK